MKKTLSEEEYKEVAHVMRLLARAKTKKKKYQIIGTLPDHLQSVITELNSEGK